MMGNCGYGSGLGFFGMSFGWVFMILFWGLIIWGIVALVQSTTKPDGDKDKSDALEILKVRYAKGEVSKEEFEEKRRDLQN